MIMNCACRIKFLRPRGRLGVLLFAATLVFPLSCRVAARLWPFAPPTPEKAAPSPPAGAAQSPAGSSPKPLDFKPPLVNHTELANGVTLDYFAEPTIPLVTVLLRLRVGEVDDPPGKTGAAELTAEVLKNGGTAALPGDLLDRQIEARGAQLVVETDREETWLRLSVLKEDLPWGLGLLADLLRQPAFPPAKLEEARARTIVALRERLDVPQDVASALFPQLVYGKGNPWGWTPTEQTVKAITIDDLRAVFTRYYVSGNIKLGICGAVTWDDAQRQAAGTIGLLAPQAAPAPTIPDVKPVERSRVYIVAREATQNVACFGHEGVVRFDPLKFPIKVFNHVLSGGFTSRLVKEIRSDRGLAYEVYGNIGEGTRRGIYQSFALTKVESTGPVLTLMRQIDLDLMQHNPSWQEVELSRQSEINSFVFFFDTPEKIVRQKIYFDGFGYPKDYLATYTDKLKAVTPDQVKEAAAGRLHPDRAVVLVVGRVDPALRAELARFGPITDISDEELRSKWM